MLLAPAERGLPVAEYSANLVKKSVVGAGHAEKAQVQMMVRRLLPGCAVVEADAADALAVAICHAHHAGTLNAWRPARRGGGAMIAKLAGIVDQVGPDGAVIDVGGVGYLVFCSSRTLGQLPPPGGAVRLLIETHVREDHIHLYGFVDAAERDWFRLLTTVQGVGARLALAILSAVAPEALTLAIVAQDKAMLARADGVGPEARRAHRQRVARQGRRPGAAPRPTPPHRRRRRRSRRRRPATRSRRWSISAIAAPRRSARSPRRRAGSATAPRSTR